MKIEEAVTILKDYRNFLIVGQEYPIENKKLANAISSLLHDRLEFKSCKEPVMHRINFSNMKCYDCDKDLINNNQKPKGE